MSFAKTTHLRRVPQGFNPRRTPSRATAWAAGNGPQVRRKNDPFSPQARWGDDGARQVQIGLPNVARLGEMLDAPLGHDLVRTAPMTMPILFEFEGLPVQVVTEQNGEHWFCAKDVCTIPGYSNSKQVISDNCREKGVRRTDTLREKGKQELQFIDEGNLYRLIIRSRKEEAKHFESWVCDEVLPALRRPAAIAYIKRSCH